MQEVIRIENLTRFYTIGEETVRALNGINLTIQKNEYVALANLQQPVHLYK